jgi:hypothetical protein
MQALQRESRKNYIGIVSARMEQQRSFESPAKSDRPIKDYLLRLIAAVLDHGGNAGL